MPRREQTHKFQRLLGVCLATLVVFVATASGFQENRRAIRVEVDATKLEPAERELCRLWAEDLRNAFHLRSQAFELESLEDADGVVLEIRRCISEVRWPESLESKRLEANLWLPGRGDPIPLGLGLGQRFESYRVIRYLESLLSGTRGHRVARSTHAPIATSIEEPIGVFIEAGSSAEGTGLCNEWVDMLRNLISSRSDSLFLVLEQDQADLVMVAKRCLSNTEIAKGRTLHHVEMSIFTESRTEPLVLKSAIPEGGSVWDRGSNVLPTFERALISMLR